MATTESNYTGNGSLSLYDVGFDYLDDAHVKVTLNGVITTAFSVLSTKQVQFTTAPGAGVAIRIYRETNDADLSATFYPGSSIKADDLNNNFKQGIYIAQETSNKAASAVSTANGIAAVANAALPKAGGTMTGALVFAAGQPTATTAEPNIVQLTDSIISTSTTTAATANSVKALADVRTRYQKPTYLLASTYYYTNELTYNNVPSWTERITVNFFSMATSAPYSDTFLIQLGTASGNVTTGYTWTTARIGSTADVSSATDGFKITQFTGSSLTGTLVLTHMGSNVWTASSNHVNSTSAISIGSGGRSFTAAITSLTINTGPFYTFQSGAFSVIYEGIVA